MGLSTDIYGSSSVPTPLDVSFVETVRRKLSGTTLLSVRHTNKRDASYETSLDIARPLTRGSY
jgi:hypothetical protein